MKYLISLFIACFVVAVPVTASDHEVYVEAVINEISETTQTEDGRESIEQSLTFTITRGERKGEVVKSTSLLPVTESDTEYEAGDEVVILLLTNPETKEQTVVITDYMRRFPLFILLGLFLVIVILVSKIQGILSFIAMLITFMIISEFVVAQIIQGANPIGISILSTVFIAPITFYMSHGINKKTTIALVSTIFSLSVTAILSYFFIDWMKLSGFGDDQAVYLPSLNEGVVNVKNLLVASVIIGTLGVLDDITISQAAIVEKLKRANPKYGIKELYKNASEIGNDHIASLVNTLILVYAGASLPLFLIFSGANIDFLTALNNEIVTTEIARMLLSSIGLVGAVPITTILASVLFAKTMNR